MAEKKKNKKESIDSLLDPDVPPEVRTVIYFELQNACNLPDLPDLYLTLEQNSIELKSVKKHCLTRNLCDEGEENPAYYMSIEQDNFDEINNLCNNPLVITLSQHRQVAFSPEEAGVEEEESGETIQIARGHIDLLQFVGKTKISAQTNTFLYPIFMESLPMPGCFLLWKVHSAVPIVKELPLTNIVFITLESLFNFCTFLDRELDPWDYVVSISLRTKQVIDEVVDYVNKPLCTFKYGNIQPLNEQNDNIKWESLRTPPITESGLGIHTRDKLPSEWNRNVYRNDYLNIDLKCTSPDIMAFTFNSMHRFLLTREMSLDLEDTAQLKDGLLIEIFCSASPEEVILQGSIDLAPLLFAPDVHDCRFAVEMMPKQEEQTTGKGKRRSTRSSKASSKSNSERKAPSYPFLLLRIALSKSLCEIDEEIVMDDKVLTMPTEKRLCGLELSNLQPTVEDLSKRAYRNFEKLLETLIDNISGECLSDEGCSRANLLNAILHIVATDFNQRCQTDSNTEFYNLMTIVYNDLVGRIEEFVNDYDLRKCKERYALSEEKKFYIILKIAKMCIEIGQPLRIIGGFLLKRVNSKYKCDEVDFYFGLYYLERQCFQSCKEFIERLLCNDKNHFYGQIIRAYMHIAESDFEMDYYSDYILEILKKNPSKKELWILLYCVYKQNDFRPGQYYCQMKYENLPDLIRNDDEIKASRWDIHNAGMRWSNICKNDFHTTLNLFLQLGLYKFAEQIINEIEFDFNEFEKYQITSSLYFLQNDLDMVKEIQEATNITKENMKMLNYRITGDIAFVRGDFETAIRNYEWIFHDPKLENYCEVQLISLRCGYWELTQKNYNQAITYFTKCSEIKQDLCDFCSYYGLGICLFETCCLLEAEYCFGKCTEIRCHIPDIWAYLTLINIELENKKCAAKLYKYSRMHSEIPLDEKLAEVLKKRIELENL